MYDFLVLMGSTYRVNRDNGDTWRLEPNGWAKVNTVAGGVE